MKVPKEYLLSLIDKEVIPLSAWVTKYYNNKLCYVLKNAIYCKVFWMDFWYNYIAEKFRSQDMILHVINQDLTLPVIISEELTFVNIPTILQNIDYYARPRQNNSPFKINTTLNTTLAAFIIIMAITTIMTLVFAKNSIYSMFV
ncbi:Ac68-like protein [Homarus gammarus nudivirus]|uniref:Ac68-like protein n=1 Tax=Homarus gammarus nudivirus TaxID=2509616 RepID=A0A411HBD6_9VIRU|nr:Ac68-like protein [Homarus gammarus nudivirus]QBB28683.1 Ac68-like protein [Homarus gammarus nudivirus]